MRKLRIGFAFCKNRGVFAIFRVFSLILVKKYQGDFALFSLLQLTPNSPANMPICFHSKLCFAGMN